MWGGGLRVDTSVSGEGLRRDVISHGREDGSAIRANREMRIGLFVIGFGSHSNLNAVQPLLPLFRKVFQASEIQASLTVSASALAVSLTGPLAGVIADRLGRKRIIVTAMVGVALATALGATARTLLQLIGWRFLQGIFVPGVAAVAIAYFTEEDLPRGWAGPWRLMSPGPAGGCRPRRSSCRSAALVVGVHDELPVPPLGLPHLGRGDREIGAKGAPVRTLVIAAREDLQIAHEVRKVLEA